MARFRKRFYDPDGTRYGLPTYPWRMAPAGLATRRQLAARGLTPGRQDVAAQVMWVRYRQQQVAYLYRVENARTKKAPTARQLAALEAAMRARRTCPDCRRVFEFSMPRSLGCCPDCAGI